MNSLQQIIAGLTLIAEVEPKTSVRAEHDEIWAGEDIEKYSPEQTQKLEDLGFTPDDGCGWHRYV